MKIKIVQNPVVCGGSVEADRYRKMMQAVAGKWLEVETRHLFQDQFNTVPIKGVSEHGLRVMACHVERIWCDFRLYRIYDLWTGKNYKNKNSLPKKVRTRPEFKKWIYKMEHCSQEYKITLVKIPAYKINKK
jgi:hypothetical protein